MSNFKNASELRTPNSELRTSSRGFTMFETLAVLTVISITLVVMLGAYSSWATFHSLDGAARTLETGLLHARASAKAKSTYVMFYYETEGHADGTVKLTSGFQSFVCTNDWDRTIITDTLELNATLDCLGAGDIRPPENPNTDSEFTKQFIPLTSPQRITGHVELGYIKEADITSIRNPGFQLYGSAGLIIFCPDGSVWGWNDPSEHTIVISTRKRFARSPEPPAPIRRILRVNLATGTVTTFRPEQLP